MMSPTQIATRSRVCTEFISSNKQSMSRSRHFARADISSAQLVFGNWYVADEPVLAELGAGATASIRASIEYPAGTYTQALFSGMATGSAGDGDNLVSDAVAVSIPAGAEFWVRTYFSCSAGIIWSQMQDTGEAMAYAPSGVSDMTMGGTIVDGNASAIFRPIAIIGETCKPSVLILGDSRNEGTHDTSNAQGNVGHIERGLAPAFGTINAAKSADTVDKFLTSNTKRLALAAYCSHVVCGYGINDISGGSSAAAVKAKLEAVVAALSEKPVFFTTLEPRSSSSNAFATVGGQTISATNGERVSLNNAIRSGLSGACGYFDVADYLEAGRNDGRWRVSGSTASYTVDGLHAVARGYQLVEDYQVIKPSAIRL